MRRKYPRFNRRHAEVMKWLFDHPASSLKECSEALGYSRSWLSRIVNAPEFRSIHQRYLNEGMRERVNRLLTPRVRFLMI